MPRQKASDIEKEIKARWLGEHLEEVEKLAGEWLLQLNLGNPFYPPRDERVWEAPYEPAIEQAEVKCHVGRQHVRSRSLWTHHTTWLRLLRAFNEHRKELLKVANEFVMSQAHLQLKQFQIRRESFAFSAIWEAHEGELRRRGKSGGPPPEYLLNDAGLGVKFGDFLIEGAATKEEQVLPVKKSHENLTKHLANSDRFQEAMRIWSDIEDLEKKMGEIGRRVVKSHDILYPCQYCRHLWK
ncbi:MAG: hypothetical protein AAB037_03305 [Chloroflexota bacterium]